MNKKRILIVFIIVFIVMGISIFAFASKNLLQYTKDGKLITHATEKTLEEIEPDTQMGLAIPDIPEKSPDEIQQEEKKNFALQHSDLQNEVIEENNISTLNDEENTDEPFVKVLKKYYGNDEIENLYLKIFKENDMPINGEAKPLTDAQKEILEKTFELISSTETTIEEKEILKEALKESVSSITDDEVVKKINDILE